MFSPGRQRRTAQLQAETGEYGGNNPTIKNKKKLNMSELIKINNNVVGITGLYIGRVNFIKVWIS